ncbi:unnamed protein product [Rotaria sp. Silwood2]|nr:unnamed protein product [Rotaria sp. Silwood2]CAF2736439.1 unnamed protein product [Rotaria sp. Silwood2]CAF3003135.1 unnamed protein product [Rotaria sp. Silwood2]CAF3130137.1 unnamed protein product [Rotaria sp. Silwood2]
MNQASSEQKDSCSIDTHIIVAPIRSSYCQTEIPKHDLQTINIDLNQSKKTINLGKQLTDTLCRRLHEPLMFMNRDMFCRHNRTSLYSTQPLGQKFFQQQSHEKKELSSLKQSSLSESPKQIATTLSSDQSKKLSIINTTNLSSTTNGFSLSNIHDESSFLPNLTHIQSDETLFLNNFQPVFFDLHQRKQSHKKLKQNQRIIDDHSIPLALATSLHSNLSLYNEDYFLTKYIYPLFIDKHYLR